MYNSINLMPDQNSIGFLILKGVALAFCSVQDHAHRHTPLLAQTVNIYRKYSHQLSSFHPFPTGTKITYLCNLLEPYISNISGVLHFTAT